MPQYNGVWTLQSQSQALTSQQWVTDPNFKNTTLLLQADNAANTLQNNTFIDSSTNGLTITRGANATQGSYTQFSQQPGYWSNYFNGTSDYVGVTNNAAFNFGTGDFTIELFFYIAGNAATDPGSTKTAALVDTFPSSGTRTAWEILVGGNASTTGTSIGITNWVSDTPYSIYYTGPISQQTWHHCAIVRSGTTTTVYLDGVSVASGTFGNQNVNSGGNSLLIGYANNYASYARYFPGYISNLRIVKGAAVYTGSTYTVPTLPLSIYGSGTTSLLTCQSNRFVDNGNGNAGSGFAISTAGAPSAQAFTPFTSQYQWTPSFIGGSAYFDGSSYVTVPNATSTLLGSSDFTFEFWANRSATSALEDVVLHWNSVAGGTGYSAIRLTIAASSTSLYLSTNGTTWAVISTVSVAVPNNGWFYCALVRSGGNISLFINGTRVTTTTTITSGTALYAGTVNRVGYMNLTTDVRSWTGYVSNFRFTKSAVYDPTLTTMTVPTALTVPIANTQTQLNFTNAGIYDGTMKNVLTTLGNAQVSTSIVKYGSGSMAFDGTGDYLFMPSTATTRFGSANWTIEFWFRTAAATTRQVMLSWNAIAAGYGACNVNFLANGKIGLQISESGSSWKFDDTTTGLGSALSANTWYHLAVTRVGQIVTVYINGVSIGTYSLTASTTSLMTNDTRNVVGINPDLTNQPFNGYIDDLRVTNGVPRYYQNFIPPQVALPRQ